MMIKKRIIIVLIIVILLILGLLWKNNNLPKDNFYKNSYKETFIKEDNWIKEETLNNKVSIKNTENFRVAIRVYFDEKIVDDKGNEITDSVNVNELFEKKIYDKNWVKVNGDREYYYYIYSLDKGEEVTLSQYMLLNEIEDNDLFIGTKYVIDTNIEIVEYSDYSREWNTSKEKEYEVLELKKKDDEEIDEEEMLFDDIIERKLNKLTLEEKIGQMMIITLGKNESRLKEDKREYNLDELLSEVKPGGVIIGTSDFKKRTFNEMVELTMQIKESTDIPMIISVDQEGGRVQRLISLKDKDTNGIVRIPSMYIIGDTNDTSIAYDTGRLLGMELNALGFNMDFAPVIDTLYIDSSVIGDRSFGNNVELVTKMGMSLAKGLEDRNVIPVYKHFPNHGATSTDSHDGLPEINKTKEELLLNDLIPFKEAIKNDAKVIMVGHLYYPLISNEPSSLSKEIINDLLKNELGYDGLVVTDSLRMKAIIDKYGEKEVYEMAINAGVDLLLMPYNPDYTINYIKESIKEGKITEEQINNSVRKILKLKYSLNLNENGNVNVLDSSLYKELGDKITSLIEEKDI